jgi:hypothetical protein
MREAAYKKFRSLYNPKEKGKIECIVQDNPDIVDLPHDCEGKIWLLILFVTFAVSCQLDKNEMKRTVLGP